MTPERRAAIGALSAVGGRENDGCALTKAVRKCLLAGGKRGEESVTPLRAVMLPSSVRRGHPPASDTPRRGSRPSARRVGRNRHGGGRLSRRRRTKTTPYSSDL